MSGEAAVMNDDDWPRDELICQWCSFQRLSAMRTLQLPIPGPATLKQNGKSSCTAAWWRYI